MFKITSIKTQKLENENSKLVGLARIVIDNCFAIGDIRIIKGNEERGLFVAFPSRKQSSGEFKDICHPINSKTRQMFENEILSHFINDDNVKGDLNESDTSNN